MKVGRYVLAAAMLAAFFFMLGSWQGVPDHATAASPARPPQAGPPDMSFAVTTLSTKPWLVSGGDALVEIQVPRTVPMHQVTALLNGQDVTQVFRQVPGLRALRGVVTGLRLGSNTLEVRAKGRGRGRPSETLEITNWPITGPIVSGPHQQPFFCQTEQFRVGGGRIGRVLGPPLDESCSVEARVDYLYKSNDGTLNVLPDPGGPLPADVVMTTTIEGDTVPYVVRLETGTINRAIYEIAFLHEPGTPLPDPFTSTPGWNGRIVYRQGGGCRTGWYVQGDDTGGVLTDELLSRGYATVAASLNRFRNNCAELLSTETTMMVKEYFVDRFGVPRFTIGLGSSGGSYQSHHTADNYPGLFDGIFIGRTFPEVTFATVHLLSDARLLKRYFDAANAEGFVAWSEEEQRQVAGFGVFASIANMDQGAARIDPVPDRPDRLSAEFQSVVPEEVRYHPVNNPFGARATVYDHAVNVFGRDPATGFAGRPLDNVGIQYGLGALNAGAISTEQFLDLNERIGGLDIDANFVPARTRAHLLATRLAYRGGRLVNGGEGLAETPIVDFRNYLDLRPGGDIHMRFHSFSMRERLRKANGDADNQVMIVVDSRFSCGFGTELTCDNPALWEAFDQLDRWLVAIEQDASGRSRAENVRANKPAGLVDACWTGDDPPVRIVEEQTYDGPGVCNALYPSFPSPRIVAGSPVEGDLIACRLKPIDLGDYAVEFTAAELARLQAIFPEGVCDWTQPGLEQQPPAGTYLSVGPSPVNQIFDVVSGQEMEP
jgi:hypothetical protein